MRKSIWRFIKLKEYMHIHILLSSSVVPEPLGAMFLTTNFHMRYAKKSGTKHRGSTAKRKSSVHVCVCIYALFRRRIGRVLAWSGHFLHFSVILSPFCALANVRLQYLTRENVSRARAENFMALSISGIWDLAMANLRLFMK